MEWNFAVEDVGWVHEKGRIHGKKKGFSLGLPMKTYIVVDDIFLQWQK